MLTMPINSVRRAWLWYAAAWIPAAIFYAIPMARTRPMSAFQALMQGFSHVIPAAILGIGVWRLTQLIEWPPRNKWQFIALHLLGAVTLSVVWLGIEVGTIALALGVSLALEVS